MEARWLLLIGVRITLVSVAVLTRTIRIDRIQQWTHRFRRWVIPVSSVLILLLGFSSLETIPLSMTVVMLLLAPIFLAFRVWIEMPDRAD